MLAAGKTGSLTERDFRSLFVLPGPYKAYKVFNFNFYVITFCHSLSVPKIKGTSQRARDSPPQPALEPQSEKALRRSMNQRV